MNNLTLAKNITSYRKKLKLTQVALAKRLGVTQQAIGRWESAQATPTIDQLNKLSEIFGVSIDHLVKEEAKEQSENTQNISTEHSFGSKFEGADFSKMNITHAFWANKIKKCNYDNSIFTNAGFNACDIVDSKFNSSVFTVSDIKNSNLNNNIFDRATFQNSKFSKNNMKDVSFKGANFNNIDFSLLNVKTMDFTDAKIVDSVFSKTNIRLSTFTNTEFKNVKINLSNFGNNKFKNCTFSNCSFQMSNMGNNVFTGCTFDRYTYNFALASKIMSIATDKTNKIV